MNTRTKVRLVRRLVRARSEANDQAARFDGLMCGNDSEVMGLIYKAHARRDMRWIERILKRLDLDVGDAAALLEAYATRELRHATIDPESGTSIMPQAVLDTMLFEEMVGGLR